MICQRFVFRLVSWVKSSDNSVVEVSEAADAAEGAIKVKKAELPRIRIVRTVRGRWSCLANSSRRLIIVLKGKIRFSTVRILPSSLAPQIRIRSAV